jgi:hypothetical protein
MHLGPEFTHSDLKRTRAHLSRSLCMCIETQKIRSELELTRIGLQACLPKDTLQSQLPDWAETPDTN